eukprot:CAMPEP_0172441254 /NCGR_PEP_ID=MMETSP1065-20121228/1815_1 /TAXON_ID=265537 /ORGANISM="Amphiprora paludosa, Strain CCMP125" /LENGTH=205 /DNA_ID=CAMNT_0013190515 /DNA_START=15 /DNA_END=632 /DNA_ORIENTATION=+
MSKSEVLLTPLNRRVFGTVETPSERCSGSNDTTIASTMSGSLTPSANKRKNCCYMTPNESILREPTSLAMLLEREEAPCPKKPRSSRSDDAQRLPVIQVNLDAPLPLLPDCFGDDDAEANEFAVPVPLRARRRLLSSATQSPFVFAPIDAPLAPRVPNLLPSENAVPDILFDQQEGWDNNVERRSLPQVRLTSRPGQSLAFLNEL